MNDTQPANSEIAGILEEIADLLETQDANPFRVRAYRQGARSVQESQKSIADLVRHGGRQALTRLSGIGSGLAGTIEEYVQTGRSSQLDRLRGEVSPADLLRKVPGIGPELSRRISAQLDIHTLEELERAAHDGRLEEVGGFGPKRIEAVQASLAGILSQSAQRRSRQRVSGLDMPEKEPDVATLLDVDKEYRRKAGAGHLRKIAPKRFNPENEAWLPILHAERGPWNFTVLYSNTARAHELNRVYDWVVIYYDRDGQESQCTVVTETHGPLEGRRVVRGREAECREYYNF
ncbi:MAG: helix-hairpin-helix domain-containing protein [Anaerolineales bacterium]|jgi:DNA polymerase (family 10)